MKLYDVKKCAFFGDPAYQLVLGALHWFGVSVDRDKETAVKWLTRSAEQGCRQAAFALYLVQPAEQGADRSPLHWLKESANSGFAPAQLHVGANYLTGRGVEKNLEKAVAWIKKAVDQKYTPAMFYLASLYNEGTDIEKNEQLALQLYRDAAELGDPVSANMLGMKLVGLNDKKRIEEGLSWIKKAAASDQLSANLFLFQVYLSGQYGEPKDEDLAELFRLRAERLKIDSFRE